MSSDAPPHDSNASVEPAKSTADPNVSSPIPLAVAAIGASAGGLAALKQFFPLVPEKNGLAYVVVVHLSPKHDSHLAELLQPHTKMPVRQVTETMALEADHVYVIPPGANLEAVDTHLRLTSLEPERRQRAPIDHFFRTLAKTHDGRSIGVVLTGTGADGTLGLREIKEHGGLAIVQDPNEAEFDGMPQSVISMRAMDIVLKLAEIPRAILSFADTTPRVPLPENETEIDGEAKALLGKVFAMIRTRTGRDFRHYKRSTVLRRVARRMQFNHLEELDAYTQLLKDQPHELSALADDLLINVSSFFRDPPVFEYLSEKVIPELFDREPSDAPLRVWSVGCATGEEAYSLAILILEEAYRRDTPRLVQVFASDLHEQSLQKAREGFYPGDIQSDVTPERLKRFFIKEDGGYRVRKEVRELVVFSPHNLLSDPPFSRLDLVVCRNLLIYLQREIQPDVVGLFHYALRVDGLLVLGSAETLEAGVLFMVENKPACLYRKRNVPASEPRLPVFPLHPRRDRSIEPSRNEPLVERIDFGKLHQQMAESYAPASILIDSGDRVVYLSAHAGRYIYYPGGEVTNSIFKLVREELQLELRAAVAQARKAGEEYACEPIFVRFDNEICSVVIKIRPAHDPRYSGLLLILFEEHAAASESQEGPETTVAHSYRDRERIRLLGWELDHSQQSVRTVIQEYETSREELRSSNEELQSANEELSSTLEELETSKEELQSMYEELQTVNQENRHKVEELAQLSSDLQNLLAAIDIATIFLDRELRILRFTPKVGELFNFRTADRGRHLADYTHRLGYPELQEDAKQVLSKLIPIEREAQDEKGNWYLTRVLPYRDSDERIAGVVITCIDISSRKQAELALAESEERFRVATDAVNGVIYEHDLESGRVQWSSGLTKVSGYELDETGASIKWWWERVHTDDRPELDRQYETTGKLEREFRLRHRSGHWIHLWDQAMVIPNEEGEPAKIIGCAVDVTAQREFEESLQQMRAAAEAANASRGEFLANMSHEIRTPMTAILGHADILGERLEDPDDLHCVETINRNGHFLLEVINDILDLSKIDAGRLVVARKPVRLGEIVNDAISLMDVRANEKKLPLQVEFVGLLPEIIETDAVRLRQVLLNLLSNAIKFTEQGRVRLVVRVDSKQNRLVFDVVDTGVGIRPEDLSKLFEPFIQADASTTRPFEGTGLGLTISRRLARALGGELSVQSKHGEGSIFSLSINGGDLENAHRVHLKREEPARVHDLEKPPSITGTVLIVDDRRDMRYLSQRLIEKAGGTVISAENGHEAIAVIGNDEPGAIDLVVMDMHMPEMDGYEATRQLRARGFTKPIIALTANAMVGDRNACIEAGCNDYVAKPIDALLFVRTIARQLQGE